MEQIKMPSCPVCKVVYRPGAAHLSDRACIKELQMMLEQAGKVIDQQRTKLAQSRTLGRVAWIMINAFPNHELKVAQDVLNNMPRKSMLLFQASDEGVMFRAEIKDDDAVDPAITMPPSVAGGEDKTPICDNCGAHWEYHDRLNGFKCAKGGKEYHGPAPEARQ